MVKKNIVHINLFVEPDLEIDSVFLDTGLPHWADSIYTVCDPIEASRTEEFDQERKAAKKTLRSSQLSKNVRRKGQDNNHASFTKLLLKTIRERYPQAGKKYLECDMCDLRFQYRSNLKRHMQRWHMTRVMEPKPLKKACCEVCGKLTSDLTVHMRIHTGELPYACSFENCKRAFYTSTQLKNHLARHSYERPFKCDECSACFRVKNTLWSHKHHVHNVVRPYECGQCGLSFKDRYSFKQHESIHSGERPFNCELCSRSFRQRGVLQVHMNVHTDTRPYKCRECVRDFHSPAARRSHEKIVHKMK